MTTQTAPPPPRPALTADDYAAAAGTRRRRFLWGAVMLSLIVGGVFATTGLVLGQASGNLLAPLAVLLGLLMPLFLWRLPRLSLYVTFAAVCLVELAQTGYADAITDRVPFFWNVNTIFQVYAHLNFKAIPLNLLEVFILTSGICSLLRSVFSGTARLKAGTLFVPILVYMAFVMFAWVNGMATGGDFKISLQEVRSQFYFLLAYLMAVNSVQEKRQVGTLLWMTALCIGLKGILYTFRRYVTLHGQTVPDQGVGSHEEAFFFDAFVVLLIVLALCGVQKKLQWVMWSLLPFVLLGNLATNRRAATAAMVVIVPLLLLTAYRALPARRRMVGIFAAVLAVTGPLYYFAFKDSNSSFAQPARAIKSNFQPDERDASSNAYRDAENADLMATIKSAPVQGYGYGKRMIHAVPIADISADYEWWDIMTHNQILWVWMRVGTLGFLAFWMMIGAILIRGCLLIREESADNETKAAGMFALVTVGMLMIFGLLDLQLSNFRDMLFAGFWAGYVGVAPDLTDGLQQGLRQGQRAGPSARKALSV